MDLIGALTPIFVTLLVLATLAGLLAAAFAAARKLSRLHGHEAFDVGGPFDQFYIRVLPPFKTGTIYLIYAGYLTVWLLSWPTDPDLPWLNRPWGNPFIGAFTILAVLSIGAYAARDLLKAFWFALRWIRLEGRGMRWHTADSGEKYRIIWRRPGGEYLFDTTIRTHLLQQELTARRKRRAQLAKTGMMAGGCVVLWIVARPLIVALLSDDTVAYLDQWDVLSVLVWSLFLFSVVPAMVELAAAVIEELVYRAEAQFITGAKVLGSRNVPLSRKHVEAQKAHGDADFVSAAEAVRRMTGQSEP